MASPALVALTHEAGALVFPWTVNDRVTMRLLLERGVDGVITDQPELFIHVVREVLGDQKFSPNKK